MASSLRPRVRHFLKLGAVLFAACCARSIAEAAPSMPILISAPNSTRAIALDAVAFTPEPFNATPSSLIYDSDQTTSIMLFALNLSLKPGEDASAVTADAEDAAHRHYTLKVEYVGQDPGEGWLTQLNLRLDRELGDVGDVLIRISYLGVSSNRVRVGVGHVGGGPEDDVGAAPTPAPPYTISGRITSVGSALSGSQITLSGSQAATTTTDNDGSYSFTIGGVGDYTITPSKKFYRIAPASKTFDNLSRSQTADFSAVLETWKISGTIKDDQGQGLDNVAVTLKSSAGDSPSRTLTTSGGGLFSFPDLPAGFSYTVTPTNTSLYTFTAQNVGILDQDAALSFGGTLRRYSISGLVADRAGHGTSGVSVTLSGPLNLSATTGADGHYSFGSLPAGQRFNVVVAKTDYIFSPQSQSYNLLKDENTDFTAIRLYRISGRVTDGGGKGILGIRMNLSGPETGSVLTPADGSYSFTVTTTGNYILTPTKEQDFYQFSPASRSFTDLSDHQVTNFIGTLSVTGPTYALEFDGNPITVDYGAFWPQDTNVGHFFWEFWAMPGENNYARYILSDGYGGAHALLFGFNYGLPGHYSLMGNVWTGTQTFSFSSSEGPSAGEWAHIAVGWDGQSIITYYDGVPVGKQAFTGPRVSTGFYNGSTLLLIGGSNHQNFIGRIAQVRGFEENNPREGSPESAFTPETIFSVGGQLLSYYFRPAERVADLSSGYNGAQHSGWPRGFYEFYFNYECPGCPTPQFVIDPNAPDFINPSNSGQMKTVVNSPPATPGGARVFDSFSRPNSTYILNGKGGLGVTEAGSAGPQAWQTNQDAAQPQPFGILAGRAVLLGHGAAVAWVSTKASTGNLDVRVDRTLSLFGSGENTGLSFRVSDKNNFFFAYTSNDEADPAQPKKLSLGYYQAGVRTVLASGVAMPSTAWRTLRVVTTQAGDIRIYADGALVYSTANTFNVSATGAGLFNNAAGMALTNRWANFTVLDAQ